MIGIALTGLRAIGIAEFESSLEMRRDRFKVVRLRLKVRINNDSILKNIF